MSLVWTLIATFLYVEIAVVLLLVLPIAGPQRWQRFFRSRFLAMLTGQAQMYFYLLIGVLVLFVLEAIREMRKYSHHDEATTGSMNHEMQQSMRLFRAQRNFYIAGFAIFLVLVIRRLVTLISAQATLLAQAEASLRQAQSASDVARKLMKDGADSPSAAGDKKSAAGGKPSAPAETELKTDELKQQVATLEADLVRERKDKEALKSQSESLAREYDRLTEEYSKLQRHVTVSSSAKDD